MFRNSGKRLPETHKCISLGPDPERGVGAAGDPGAAAGGAEVDAGARAQEARGVRAAAEREGDAAQR